VRVRRRVDAAQRRALRAAVTVGGSAIAVLVAADSAFILVTLGDAARAMAVVQVAEMIAAVGIAIAARRALWRPEWLAMALVLLVFSITLLRIGLIEQGRLLPVAHSATILVGTGLFLPWSRRWHAAWLSTAVAMTIVFAALPPPFGMLSADHGYLVLAVLSAAGASLVGQALWQDRLRRMLEQQFELRWLSRHAQLQEARVSDLNRELARTARLDALTAVGNRLALDEALARLLEQGDRLRPRRVALVLLDLDHFKDYNDRHGHLAGDAALGRVGEILRHVTRDQDLCFRYGGEEFLLVLPDLDLTGAIAVAERVRQAVEEDEGSGLPPVTISGGVALCDPADGSDPFPLLRRADTALYLAKHAGRNRIAADEVSVAMQRGGMAPVA